jgi:hypothetical protein
VRGGGKGNDDVDRCVLTCGGEGKKDGRGRSNGVHAAWRRRGAGGVHCGWRWPANRPDCGSYSQQDVREQQMGGSGACGPRLGGGGVWRFWCSWP